MRKNPQTKELSGYYRLMESYRNHHGLACHRTMLSAGFLEELNAIQKILTAKVANLGNPLFELPSEIRIITSKWKAIPKSSKNVQ